MKRVLISVFIAISNQSLWSARIDVGNHELTPNRAGQIVDIMVEGGDLVAGVDLFVQIGDGGPALAAFGLPPGTNGPAITSVELVDGTIFDGVTDSPTNIGSLELDQVAFYTLALIGPTESTIADGVLARLTVDTSGFYGGSWELKLDNVLPYSQFSGPYTTNFAGSPIDITNGQISIAISFGDFNDDGQFDIGDINALTDAIQNSISDSRFDVNEDGQVDSDDRGFWISNIARTYFGDSNLDGEFNTSDLIDVFQAQEYEDDIPFNSTWATGDWNGDSEFSTTDLIVAFQSNGFEQGPRTDAMLVPEPTCRLADVTILVMTLKLLLRRRR